ncbi:1239_t:CDS:2 [Paraglomus brasilianum]|uniref:1239_t:CDS:1 n=1 Tax=Paraglomus brasilianum TaxID=144538 RepID=A0A9N9FZL0_9GLOM|nr:1239_t:CDS:2 [Paraglomus brasilianum]
MDLAVVSSTLGTINRQLKRGVTVSIENYHEHYVLKNMEYYCETDCLEAPTISIPPTKGGVTAFKSSIAKGPRGLLIYEFKGVDDAFTLAERLFLIIGWDVPLVSDNHFFLRVAHVESKDFPKMEPERQRVLELLFKNKVKAGNSISWDAYPEVVTDQIVENDDKEEAISKSGLSVSASMATAALANIKVELYPRQSASDEQEQGILRIGPPPQSLFTRLVGEAENLIKSVNIKEQK